MKNNSEASKAPDEAFGATHVLTCKTEFAENVVPDRIAALPVSHDTRNRRCVGRRPEKAAAPSKPTSTIAADLYINSDGNRLETVVTSSGDVVSSL
jgi:hypothetical protein